MIISKIFLFRKSSLKGITFLLVQMVFLLNVNAQTNIFPSTGNTGIGTISPAKPLEVVVPTSSSHTAIINIKDMDYSYSADRNNQAVVIPPAYAIDNTYGITWHNDGYNVGTALVVNQKIMAYGTTTATQKSFKITDVSNNYPNFSLELSNNGSTSNPDDYWVYKPNTSIIAAWNKPLCIGSYSNLPVRLYSDGGTANKVADIFIRFGKIGIGTETPDANAKLDVNGNIFSNGKIAIGTTDMAKIGTYSLAVNGDALFNKVKVKVYSGWPDYVFSDNYELPSLTYVEQYIKKHKHLPELPAANEMEKEGIDVADNAAILLKKIEELTLYVIALNKKDKELSEKIEELVAENKLLKSKIGK